MFKTTTFAGIPMMTRRNRRLLVVTTYALVVALAALVFNEKAFWSPGIWIIVAISIVSRGIFGVLVQQEIFPVVQKRAIESRLELTITGAKPTERPDERDVSERNAAYFQAFRVVAIYAFFAWIVGGLLELAQRPAPVLQVVLIVLVFTLPQAILLWNQPDLAEEK